ncbi:hypothetical protein MYX78_09590 [Acidobacteria bacterium AH-259-G07]|nr:hypothetical protein [Acidobacteria bacterium AH-259-G07]
MEGDKPRIAHTIVCITLLCFSSGNILGGKINGKKPDEVVIYLGALKIEFKDANFKLTPPIYYIKMRVTNTKVGASLPGQPPQLFVFEKNAFHIVDFEGEQHDVKGKNDPETIVPGAYKEYTISFRIFRRDKDKPAVLYYKDKRLAEINE